MPSRVLHGDQRGQLQRLGQADAAKLPQRVLRDQEVAAVDCSLEGRPRVALCGRAWLSGAGRPRQSLTARGARATGTLAQTTVGGEQPPGRRQPVLA